MACALLSVAAHAMLLDALTSGTLGGSSRAAAAAATAPAHSAPAQQSRVPVQVRMLAQALRPSPATSASAAQDEAAPTPVATPTVEAAGVSAEAQALAVAEPDTAPPVPSASASTTLDTYIPRPELTLPPVRQTPVVLSAPEEGDSEPARRVGVLALYIDETGRVHHIESDEPRLPPPYERAAREAFMTAVYTPGQLDGRVVKSRIRVEVVFDNTPLDTP